jgi:M6 family metalloprotease-like protein
MERRNARVLALCPLVLLLAIGAHATPPPRSGHLPKAYLERIEEDPKAFTFSRALIGQAQRVQRNRELAARTSMTEIAARAAGGVVIEGERSIPVLAMKFRNTARDPYPIDDLQRELFDGPFPTGTMTDYYREVSYGRLTVTGTVRPWQTLARDDAFYEGADFRNDDGDLEPCHGMCAGAGTGDLLKESLDANDPGLDFGVFDNDGPDGDPNSGDDDGFVDFVAFVHPERGGECTDETTVVRNIWSHRWAYQNWKGGLPYTTRDRKQGGGFIKINDYVITPALACDDSTMIQIGVFAHEFGHAFGLPDLYDTDSSDGESEGVGNWCLMGSGAWGGDGESPARPAHMSAWAKSFLGWIFPETVDQDFDPARISASETAALAYKIPISKNQFYLIENRQRTGFDERLEGEGLLIWKINQSVVNAGLVSNRVNADETNRGVGLEQADGLNDLDGVGNRGDGGDVFAGTSDNRRFHNSSIPRSIGRVAVCDVSDTAPAMTAKFRISSGNCPAEEDRARAAPAATAAEALDATTLALSVKELEENPTKYQKRKVRLTGKLVNLGSNFFTDRRIALQDAEGNTIDVQPWLPLERARGDRSGSQTLAGYLDKQVELIGELERGTGDDNREIVVLEVESAQVIPPG